MYKTIFGEIYQTVIIFQEVYIMERYSMIIEYELKDIDFNSIWVNL